MFTAIKRIAKPDGLKTAELTGEGCLGLTNDKPFIVQSVADQIGDADQAQSPLACVRLQFWQPSLKLSKTFEEAPL